MDLSKISVRYAKALFLLGKEKSLLDRIKADMVLISGILLNADFKSVIESPVIKPSQKTNAVVSVFKGKIHELTLNFLDVLIKNKRERNLEGICRRFLYIYAQEMGVKTALITTATSLDAQVNKMLSQILAKEFNATIELEHKLNPEILGGYILKVGDQQYDASVANSLRKIKQVLVKSDFSKN